MINLAICIHLRTGLKVQNGRKAVNKNYNAVDKQ